jgi:hypothetical protein
VVSNSSFQTVQAFVAGHERAKIARAQPRIDVRGPKEYGRLNALFEQEPAG